MTKQKLTSSSLYLLALFMTIGPNAVASSTWYVNGARGNDNNNCKSSQAACKTIGHAISQASSGDSIIVASATYKESLGIAFDLTIVGSAARTTIIDGGASATVVTVNNAGAQVSLSGLTIRNGLGVSQGGGGIHNVGTLTITNTTVSGNSSNDSGTAAGGLGGGIYNAGTLTVLQSTVSGNSVTRYQIGAIPFGAGIYNTGKLTITNSTLSGNQAADYWPAGAPYGGGIANVGGTVMISNATISNNSALIHTPYGTAGTYGGGIYNAGPTMPTLQNSIVANNKLGGNCNGVVNSDGYNLSGDTTCSLNGPGDQKSTNPMLGPLQNNGGPTQTMALLAGSPAMLAGNPNGCTDGNGQLLTTDQRGVARPSSGPCDIGAYQH